MKEDLGPVALVLDLAKALGDAFQLPKEDFAGDDDRQRGKVGR